MGAKKNKISGIEFVRNLKYESVAPKHQIRFQLTDEIPPLGYGKKEIMKMLKKFFKSSY